MSSRFEKLREIVAQLRAPGGCPWDREQTNASLSPKLVEEVYEAVAAIRNNDDANLREELGDVLLLVLMHAEIAREQERFDIDQVIESITAKLIRRHPHVFGDSAVRDSAGVVRQWDAIKLDEKKEQQKNYLDEVGAALPALMRAQKVQRKAAHVNFDWKRCGRRGGKSRRRTRGNERSNRLDQKNRAIEDEIGDLLFAVVNLARENRISMPKQHCNGLPINLSSASMRSKMNCKRRENPSEMFPLPISTRFGTPTKNGILRGLIGLVEVERAQRIRKIVAEGDESVHVSFHREYFLRAHIGFRKQPLHLARHLGCAIWDIAASRGSLFEQPAPQPRAVTMHHDAHVAIH